MSRCPHEKGIVMKLTGQEGKRKTENDFIWFITKFSFIKISNKNGSDKVKIRWFARAAPSNKS